MLIIDERTEAKLTAAKAHSLAINGNLLAKLEYLHTYACRTGTTEDGTPIIPDIEVTKTYLYPDFAPHSFEFVITKRRPDGTYATWFQGGLIFHGSHDRGGDGGAPTYSVSLNPSESASWEIHT